MNAGATQDQARTIRAWRVTLCALTACAAWFVPFVADADARRAGPRLDSSERAVVVEINRVRSQYGLPRLRTNHALNRSADFHTSDMLRANFFGHASSNGTSMESRLRRYRPSHRLGENLAYVPRKERRRGPRSVVQMWMNSSGHRAILLSPGFRRVGVGRRTGAFGNLRAVVYTADFASAR